MLNQGGEIDCAEIQSDFCVIGTGPAGITVARELAAKGHRVLILESGQRHSKATSSDLLSGFNTGRRYPIDRSRRRAFGGTSVGWNPRIGLRCRPLDEIDFEERSTGVGWPFSKTTLSPYYRKAAEQCRVLEFSHIDQHLEPNSTKRLIDHPDLETKVFQRGPLSTFSDFYDEFSSSDQIRLILDATVVNLNLRGDAVGSVDVRSTNGKSFRVSAKQFVVACGGIENARILLASNKQRESGIGNEHDLVGRFFMEHPHIHSGMLVLRDRKLADRMNFYQHHFFETYQQEGLITLAPSVLKRESLPNVGFWLHWTSIRGTLLRATTSVGNAFAETMRGNAENRRRAFTHFRRQMSFVADLPIQRLTNRKNRHLAIELEVEQTAMRNSRVTLDDRCDQFGVPRASLHWAVASADWEAVRRSQQCLDRIFRELKLGYIVQMYGDESPEPKVGIGNHHMGTTTMHVNPNRGVVDANCKVHSVANLYIAGSSVFPTAGSANPTLTIVALSIRLAEHLANTTKRAKVLTASF